MKKFSNITGQKVGQEPKIENKIDESDLFRNKVRSLIDQFLRIRSNGSVDNRYRAGSVSIEGKELLTEAIIDLLSENNTKEQTKVLEGLKSKINDWEVIDREIELINNPKPTLTNKNKFNSILEKWSSDEESLVLFVENSVNKIDNKKTLIDYTTLVSESKLTTETKVKLSNIYINRLNQIG